MRVCLLSKFGISSNLLYQGVRVGLHENNVEYIDINIEKERGTKVHWISIPTLERTQPLPIDRQILDQIDQFKPNYIFALQYSGISFLIDNQARIKQILGKNGKVIFWMVDLAEKIYENILLGSNIDSFFLSNEGQIAEYKKKWQLPRIFFMPQGALIAQPDGTNVLDKSIGFLGRRQDSDLRYQSRNRMLDLFKNTVGLSELSTVVSQEEVVNFYQTTKIILGLSWKNDVSLYSSDRLFNVLGAGGFYLCAYFPGLERLFSNHTHLVWFHSPEEAIKLAQYYLSHDQERKEIATAGQRLVRNHHTYTHRIKNILDIIERKTGLFYGFL